MNFLAMSPERQKQRNGRSAASVPVLHLKSASISIPKKYDKQTQTDFWYYEDEAPNTTETQISRQDDKTSSEDLPNAMNDYPHVQWSLDINKSNPTLVVGAGLMSGFTKVTNNFCVDVISVGSEDFFVSICGPPGVKIKCQKKNDFINVAYTVVHPGSYEIALIYRGCHFGKSPFMAQIANYHCAASKVTAEGAGLMKCQPGEVAKFQLNTVTAGRGLLTVTVSGVHNCPVVVSSTSTGYAVEYLAFLPGWYNINVQFNGIHILCSPFVSECDNIEDEVSNQETYKEASDHEDEDDYYSDNEDEPDGENSDDADDEESNDDDDDDDDEEDDDEDDFCEDYYKQINTILWIAGTEAEDKNFWICTDRLPCV